MRVVCAKRRLQQVVAKKGIHVQNTVFAHEIRLI